MAVNKIDNRKSDIVSGQTYHDFLHPRYWPVWLVIAMLWLITRLPFGWQTALGRTIGRLSFLLVASRRKVCRINIRRCFPDMTDQDVERLARQTFASYGQGLMESLNSWLGRPDKFKSRLHFKGLEHVEAAQKEKQGILMIGGHFSILDFAGGLLGTRLPYFIVQRHHDNPLFNHFMTRSRLRHADGVIGRLDVRTMVKTLKKGGIVWYAPDQDMGRNKSVFAPFFEIPTATVTGTTALAKMSGAAVIPVFYYRDEHQHYHVEFSAPLAIPGDDELSDATTFNHWLETRVKERPEQYYWLHKRFKTRPEGEPPFYQVKQS